MWRNGRRRVKVRHRWGSSQVEAQRLTDSSGRQSSMYLDAELDHSGWTPHALELLSDLAGRLPFEEAAQVANNFGLRVSKSELERLVAPLSAACRELSFENLRQAQAEPVTPGTKRLMVLEVDGVQVLGRPVDKLCSGIEIKTVALYPYATPSERLVIADIRQPEALRKAIRGLLTKASLSVGDTLVGVGDGAAWVEDTLDSFCDVSITDCYHASHYFEQLMLAFAFSENERTAKRKALCRGEIDMAEFSAQHPVTPEQQLSWDEEALTALRYLRERVKRMAYPTFKQQGFPIGSGVIEGLNKSLIAARMKRSGMQWSRQGAARMAALRAWLLAKQKLIDFCRIRQLAFPPPSRSSLALSP